jgi:hypothetical protein
MGPFQSEMSYELVFSSQRAEHLQLDSIREIVRHSRTRNQRMGVTGLMAFDGQQFCQLLEGGATILGWLADIIGRDSRHSHFKVLHAGARPGLRRFPACPLAFAQYDPGVLDSAITLRSGSQVAEFLEATDPARIDNGA